MGKKKKVIKNKKIDTLSGAEENAEENVPADFESNLVHEVTTTSEEESVIREPMNTPKLAAELKQVSDKKIKVPKVSKKEIVEEETFQKPKLRKTEVLKHAIVETKLESVPLKAHAFEKEPQDVPDEMTTLLKLGKPLQ